MEHVYTVEIFTHKENGIMTFLGKLMNLKLITLSDTRQIQKANII